MTSQKPRGAMKFTASMSPEAFDVVDAAAIEHRMSFSRQLETWARANPEYGKFQVMAKPSSRRLRYEARS